MSNLISLNVDGIEPEELEKYLIGDDSLLEDNFNIYIERERGGDAKDPRVIAAWIGSGAVAFSTLLTSLTNLEIHREQGKSVDSKVKEPVIIVIQGSKSSVEFNSLEIQTLSEENIEINLEKVGNVKKILVRLENEKKD